MYKFQNVLGKLKLLTIPMRGTKTTTILVLVRTGSKYENKNNNGISHFLEHMFFKGTDSRPEALMISSELDELGGVFNAFTSKEYTGYWAKVDMNKLEKAIELISDMLINSKFEAKEIEKEKGVVVEEINMYQDNPMILIEDLFEECLYGDQPAGWDTLGTKENICKFKRKDFISYFNSQYTKENMLVCIAGNVKEVKARRLTKKYFSEVASGKTKQKKKTIEKQNKPAIKIKYKKTDQAHMSLGVRTFNAGHKDRHVINIISAILGGSMSSRLFSSLREESGLAYYVRTGAEFYTDTGYLSSQAGVPVKRLEEAMLIVLHEYKKIKDDYVGDKELSRIKDMVRGRFVISLESSESVANWHARQFIFGNKIISIDEYYKKIEKITPKDIKRVANKIFLNKNLNLAVVGPYRGGKIFQKLLNL